MDDRQREFLDALLDTASPSGFGTRCRRVWIDHVIEFADEVSTDAYGNAVATYNGAPRSDADSSEGSGTAPSIAFAGHVDEIGLIARDIDDEGFCRLGAIGGADRTVSQGQYVRIHTDGPDGSDASDGSEEPASIPGVIGQTAIHLRERADDSLTDVSDQYVDIGTENREETAELVDVGDSITFATETDESRGRADGRPRDGQPDRDLGRCGGVAGRRRGQGRRDGTRGEYDPRGSRPERRAHGRLRVGTRRRRRR
jgi:endoglucanase